MEACKCAAAGSSSSDSPAFPGGSPAGSGLTLAMATVPPQPWEPLYPPDQALARGTVFKSLDLPFFAGGERHV